MPRYLLEVEYDGSRFSGWQKQPEARTVQGEIEKALETVLGRTIPITGSGRTDAGVHAERQFAHFDYPVLNAGEGASEKLKSPEFISELPARTRGLLPSEIHIRKVSEVGPDFHARFDAVSRQYRYQLTEEYSVFQKGRAWHTGALPHKDIMVECVKLLHGTHDFGAFCKHNPELEHTRCEVFHVEIVPGPSGLMFFRIRANRFLHHMVRSLAGTLAEAGRGNLGVDDFRKILESANRSNGGYTAPAHALYLEDVEYP